MNRSLIISESQTGHTHQVKLRCISCSRLASSTLEPASCSRRVSPQAFRTRRRCCTLSLRISAQEEAETVAESPVTEEKAKKRRAPGRQTYRPSSFQELVNDATASVRAAIEDGLTRLEVEFPALPGNIDGYKGASDWFIDSNIQLAIAASRILVKESGKKVHIVVPDGGEYNRSYKMFKATLDIADGITMGHLKENSKGVFSSFNLFGSVPDTDAETLSLAARKADVFIIVNASTIELLDVERYVEETIGSRPLVLWNLELDTLRADLGLLGFPPKELQFRFLSQFTPVFYIRQRDYSKSVAVAPFIINYSGCIFREYPGPWQVMLRQDNGQYACIAEDERRYNLGEAKEEMMAAMGLDTEEEGSAMQFLRRGYKVDMVGGCCRFGADRYVEEIADAALMNEGLSPVDTEEEVHSSGSFQL